MITDKQTLILQMAYKNNGEFTTAMANELLQGFYYRNHAHYVAELLTRMVRSGKIKRKSRGHYQLQQQTMKPTTINNNQLQLL